MKYYRPVPIKSDGHFYNEIVTTLLEKEGWHALGFKFWRPYELYRNRRKCQMIHMHWPESFWRSESKIISQIKAIWFQLIFYLSKPMGYKWGFYVHNVIPHYMVKLPNLERRMRLFILKNFDLIIGLAYNTKNDLELAFGTSGKKYVLCLHGSYVDSYPITKSRKNFRKEYGVPPKAKVVLFMNNDIGRKNKGTNEFTDALTKIAEMGDIHLLMTGSKPKELEQLVKNQNFQFIDGRIPDEEMGSLLNSVDHLFLNYKSITTSGMFFLSVAFNLPIIVPNLPFFRLHSSNKTSFFYNYNYPLDNQLKSIFNKINEGWIADDSEFEIMKADYNFERSAKINAKAFDEISY